MQKQYLKIKLYDITETGKNPRGSMNQKTIDELAADIAVHDLINPITVRKAGSKYELIAGHRRFAAMKQIGWIECDCMVVDANDDEAFEISVIENLQREEVHPMDEAIAFKSVIDKSSIEHLSARIGKDIQYITRRLKLNDLIPDVQKLFRSGELELGHCMEISRLTPEYQKQCIKKLSDSEGYGNKEIKFFKTVKQLQYYIQTQLMHSLDAAPWKKDDPKLYAKAGACSTCPKNSAMNHELFPELAKNATCLDGNCYAMKSELFIKSSIKALQNDGIDVYALTSFYYFNDDDKKKYPGMKGYVDRDDYAAGQKEGKDVLTGIMIDGPQKGQIVLFKFKSKGSSSAVSAGKKSDKIELSEAEQIKVIQEKLKRGIEIDRQKVFPEISKLIDKHKSFAAKLDKESKPLSDDEKALFVYAIETNGSSSDFNKLFFEVPYRDLKPELTAKFLDVFNDKIKFAHMVRNYFHSKLGTKNVEHNQFLHDSYLRIAAYHGIKQASVIWQAQDDVRKRREDRAVAKIEQLKGLKLPEKKKGKKDQINDAAEKSRTIAAKQANEKLDAIDAAAKKTVKKPAKKTVKKPVKKAVAAKKKPAAKKSRK